MTELRLLHLTFAGMGRETARVVFDPRLTIVYGASDTGKSFVTESIDYMLGARKLSLIPEAEGYSQILLGIALPDASVITLMRAPHSGRVSVFEDDVRDLVYRSPDLVLSAQHSPRTTKNLSRYLMERIGLDGSLLATNDSGGTKLAGFRDLLHLCLISETRMVSKVSPVLRTSSGTSGQTAHKSALKLLLTGEGEQSFDRAMERTLDAWRVRREEEVAYDQYAAELYVGERSRSGHGKGMRAVLHAAFTTALADYCLQQRRSHPGFIVLDSPLVTFREPGEHEADLRQSVPRHFYRHLLNAFRGQAIVVENTDPPSDILDQAQVYMFSREAHGQRFGFFPLTSSSSPAQ